MALVANTTPVAFGSLGIPITTLGGLLAPILGHDTQTTTRALSAMAGRQLSLFSIIMPAYIVVVLAGWRRMIEVWPAALTAGADLRAGAVRGLELRRAGQVTAALSALFSLGLGRPAIRILGAAAELRFLRRGNATVVPTYVIAPAGARLARAYGTYGILIVVVLIGQIGNFAGMATL